MNLEFEMKEAYYNVLVAIRPNFLKESYQVLETHIFYALNDIRAPPFVKARIASLFGVYGDIEIQN